MGSSPAKSLRFPQSIPENGARGLHVAIVMDGNGRWASKKGQPRSFGHSKGAKTVKTIVKACPPLNIKYLTLFAFSTENWKRPPSEVDFLMKLLSKFLEKERVEMASSNVIFKVIGKREELPPRILEEIIKTEELTQSNSGVQLTLAVNYSGRSEIIWGINQILKSPSIPSQIEEKDFQKFLYDPYLPDPDLFIRTAGEVRVSNFLLWQLAYSELFFVDSPWPEFSEEDLKKALTSFNCRNRKFGGL